LVVLIHVDLAQFVNISDFYSWANTTYWNVCHWHICCCVIDWPITLWQPLCKV